MNEQRVIDRQSGVDKARQIGAIKYVECSAFEKIGLEEVFDEAIKAALKKPDSKTDNGTKLKSCILL